MDVSINNHRFEVITLLDPRSQQIGMMGKRFSHIKQGMLFLMGGKEQCFWMKNCIIPLDIIMIKNNRIIKIHHNCPPCTTEDCEHYCGQGNIVLELPSGSCKKLGIQRGDNVEYLF
jgi:uncharacterized membrane protein (UPF0127 family)